MTRGAHRYPEQLYSDSPRGHVARYPIRTPQGRHTTLASVMPGRQYILPGYIVRIIDRSEQALMSHPRQPATAHVRRLQSERTEMMASRLPRSLTTVYRVMMTLPSPRGIMTSQKVFPPLKRKAELLTLYKRAFTQGRR